MRSVLFVLALVSSSAAFANSSWIDCTAYSVGGGVDKIEIKYGQSDEGVVVNDQAAKVVSSSKECFDDAGCALAKGESFAVQSNQGKLVLKLKRGKQLATESWARGETTINELVGTVSTAAGASSKVFGTCTAYNY